MSTTKLSIKEVVQLAIACPQTAIVLEGPPGSGKTYGPVYGLGRAAYNVLRIDAQNTQPDFLAALPIIDQATKTVSFVGHDVWKPRPRMAIIVDELFKAQKHVVDAFLPLIFGNEFMGHKYADDTIRIITCNNADFNLGDRELPHMGNRTTRILVADPSLEEAIEVMVERSYDSRILRWAEQDPAALISWDAELAKDLKESEAGNYYGYEPSFPRRKFVSMRSLELASHYLKAGVTGNPLRAALEGVLGFKAARALERSMAQTGTVVTIAQVRANPNDVALPSNPYDQREMIVSMALGCVEKDKAWIPKFLQRVNGEYRRLFFRYAVHKPWAVSGAEEDVVDWNAMLVSELSL